MQTNDYKIVIAAWNDKNGYKLQISFGISGKILLC